MTRNLAFDVLRIVSCILVILNHASAYYFLADSSSFSHKISVYFMTASRMGVPIFLAISGYFLLNKDYAIRPISAFYKKRLEKIGIPFIFWLTFYTLIAVALGKYTVKEIAEGVVKGQPVYNGGGHLWYVYTILGIYLITPFIKVVINSFSNKILLVSSVAMLVCFEINDWLYKPLGYFYLLGVTPLLFYFVIGKVLADTLQEIAPGILKTLLFLFSFLTMVVSFLFIVFKTLHGSSGMFSYTCIPVVVLNVSYYSFFLFAKKFFEEKQVKWPLQRIVSRNLLEDASSRTFGIYLFHFLVVNVVQQICTVMCPDANPLAIIILNTGLSFILSFWVVGFIRSVPYLRLVV